MVQFPFRGKLIIMDGWLYNTMMDLKKMVENKWDCIGVFDGTEGSGKSVLAQQCAAAVDPTFNVDRVCFEPQDFLDQVVNAKKGQAIVFDEAFRGMSARRAMSAMNHTLNAMLLEVRQKQLFIFIVLPSFFLLDSVVAVWRTRFLIHVYPDKRDGWKRGYSYGAAKSNFNGRFADGYTVDPEAYLKKKDLVLKRLAKDERKEGYEKKTKREQLLWAYMQFSTQDLGWTYKDIHNNLKKYMENIYGPKHLMNLASEFRQADRIS